MVRNFSVTTRIVQPHSVWLILSGELTSEAASLVSATIRRRLDRGDVRIRLDASQVITVEVAALDRLAEAAREARLRGGTLQMSGIAREKLFRSSLTAQASTN